jgi:hypothetical protein
MPLYPLPALVALVGWLFVFGTTRVETIAYGLISLAAGVAAFLAWSGSRARATSTTASGADAIPAAGGDGAEGE